MKTAVSALPTSDPDAPATLVDSTKVVLWGLLFWGAEHLAAAVFERSATAMVAAQAAVAEWGAGRMGIAWTDRGGPVPARIAVAHRVAIGSGLGLACASAVVLGAVATRAASILPGEPTLGVLVVGLFVAVLGAVRDELLLRGVVLRATRLLPVGATLLACGLAAAAARFGAEGRVDAALASEALRGVAFGALWVRDRGAWMACGANAAWTWAMGPVTSGGLLDVRYATMTTASSASSVAILAAAASAASFWALRAGAAPGRAP